MNGRVYDYNLGRFLSVDPFVHEGSQGINPYSYIMNNPLSGTDPTGYSPEDEVKTKTVTVTKTGSRIKSRVKVSAQSNGDGSATVTFSGNNGAAVNTVKNAVSNSLSGTGFNVSDIGSQGDIAKTDKVAPTTTTSSRSTQGNSLSSDIQNQTQDTLASIGQDFGYEYGEGVTAKYSEFGYNEDGNINQATISCDLSCQKAGADYGKITADNIAHRAMIMNFRHGQSQALAVGGTLTAAPLVIYAGVQSGVSAATWLSIPANMKRAKNMCMAVGFAALCSLKNADGKIELQMPKGGGQMFRQREAIRKIRETNKEKTL